MSKTVINADEIVVGAGLAGLTYANVAAQAGRKVVVVEKHTKPGGYATNFVRKGKYTFDCSLHKITGFGERGNLSNALQRSGLSEVTEFHPYHHLTTFLMGDFRLDLNADADQLITALYGQFPHEATALDRLFEDINTHGYQNYMIARMALGEYQLNPDLLYGSKVLSKERAYDYLRGLFKDEKLLSLLCAVVINLGVEAFEADALYFLHFAYTFVYTDKCFVKGSSQSLANSLANELDRRGGLLLLREELISIEVDSKGHTAGCESRRYSIRAPKVTFTGCPHQVCQLFPQNVIPDSFVQKLDKLEFGLGSFMVYLGLDVPPEEAGFVEQEYLVASEMYLRDAEEACHSDLRYQRWPIGITNYHALDPSNGYVLQLGVLDQQSDWFQLERSDYKERKKLIAQQLIDRVAVYFPDLSRHIKYMDISTPKTNYKFTKSGGGSSFGYKPVPNRNMRFLRKPPVDGLKFVGTWMNGAGYEPAMCLGFTMAMLDNQKS